MLSKQDIEELFDIPILGIIPHDSKVIVSQNIGLPVVAMRSKATRQFMYLSEQMITQEDLAREEEIHEILQK